MNTLLDLKKLLNLDSYDGIFNTVEKLIKERDKAAKNALAFSTELNELMCDELLDRLGLENGYTPEKFHASMKSLFNERDKAVQYHDQYFSVLNDVATNLGDPGIPFASLPSEVVKLNSMVDHLELACENYRELLARPGTTQLLERDEAEAQLAELHDTATLLLNNSAMDTNVLTSVHKLLARPDTTQPQLSEIRYVLHGDIQSCSVLYSDDTTTLLRLDEGDMMLETDTIEWSDSVTYRCQELLKSAGLNKINLVRVSGHLAQLVRDERILLNDNGDDETYHCSECNTPQTNGSDCCGKAQER